MEKIIYFICFISGLYLVICTLFGILGIKDKPLFKNKK